MHTSMSRDWYRFAGLGLFTLVAVMSMGHYLVHLLATPF